MFELVLGAHSRSLPVLKLGDDLPLEQFLEVVAPHVTRSILAVEVSHEPDS